MARRPILLANTSGMLTGVAMYGSGLLFAPFLQSPESRGYGFGATVLAAGLIMLPGALGNLAAAPVAGRLINRYGPRPALAAGPLLGGVSFALLVPLSGHMWSFSLVGLLFGFGIGLAFAAMPAVINANVPRDMTGVANGMNSVLRTVGGAVGTAVLGAILSAVTIPGTQAPSLGAYQVCFGLLAAGCFVSAVIAVLLPRPATSAEPVEDSIVRAGGPDPDLSAAAARGER
jgi:MFS family permease